MEMNKVDKARALDPYSRDPELKLFKWGLVFGKSKARTLHPGVYGSPEDPEDKFRV